MVAEGDDGTAAPRDAAVGVLGAADVALSRVESAAPSISTSSKRLVTSPPSLDTSDSLTAAMANTSNIEWVTQTFDV